MALYWKHTEIKGVALLRSTSFRTCVLPRCVSPAWGVLDGDLCVPVWKCVCACHAAGENIWQLGLCFPPERCLHEALRQRRALFPAAKDLNIAERNPKCGSQWRWRWPERASKQLCLPCFSIISEYLTFPFSWYRSHDLFPLKWHRVLSYLIMRDWPDIHAVWQIFPETGLENYPSVWFGVQVQSPERINPHGNKSGPFFKSSYHDKAAGLTWNGFSDWIQVLF